jgi:asparagine synthase (glutamine-hydrolysing)
MFSLIKDQLAPENTSAFSFYCDDKDYDELEWVNQIIGTTGYNWNHCLFKKEEFADYATKIQWHQDEPFAGLATMAYARTFEEARKNDYIVMLDGTGIDEQVGGYDYYYNNSGSLVQGTTSPPTRPHTLNREFAAKANKYRYEKPFNNELLNLQYRDIFHTKLPRALRMTDRISMAFSTEMREPFLDHELMEMCFSLPFSFKLREGKRKWIMRQIIKDDLQTSLTDAPKRPIQTPQREWLSHDHKDWVRDTIAKGMQKVDWLNAKEVEVELNNFFTKDNSNSFYIWQWVSLGLLNN